MRRRSQTHFVVLDCLSDTLLWDPIAGVKLPNSVPNTERSFNSRNGRVAVRVQGNDRRRGFRLRGSMHSSRHALSAEFAVDPNRECLFSSHPVGFPMQIPSQGPITSRSPYSTNNNPLRLLAYP